MTKHDAKTKSNSNNSTATKAPRPRRSPGYTNRRHREQMEKAVITYRLEQAEPDLTGAELEARVESEYQKLLPQDPTVRRYFDETAPVSVCPPRRGIQQLVEAKAIRDLPQMQELEQLLRMSAYGRPSDRRLVVAAFERNFLENGRPEIIAHYNAFQLANEPLHWAYGWPARDGSNRNQSSVYRTLHSTLARCDPDQLLRLNVWAVVQLRKLLDEPDIGRYLAIDGTPIPAAREQRSIDPVYPVEEQLLRRGIDSATFTTHGGRDSWRGPRLVAITDIKTGLNLGASILPSVRPEWEALGDLLTRIHTYWEEFAGEPWEPEYMVGDGHFDNDGVHRMLEERFAIHPAFGRGTPLGEEHDWHDNDGTPRCSQHGDMKLKQSQYFVNHERRRELGLRPGERADLSKAGFRWTCVGEGCPVEAMTSWDRNPRAYTYLPRKGIHRSRVALRTALMLRRNVAESFNAQLKGRGLGNRGMNVPRWVRDDREMKWLCYSAALSLTLMRLAHESGAYGDAHAEAEGRGLLRPSQPSATPAAPPATLRPTSGGAVAA